MVDMAEFKAAGAVALFVIGLGFAAGASAANIVDQSQLNVSTFSRYGFGVPTQGWAFSQTFRPSATTLSGVGIRFNLNGLDPTGASDPDDWFQLSVTSGAQTLSPVVQDFAIDADGWVTSVWTPVTVVPGDSYTINFGVFGGSQAPPYSLFVGTEDEYAGGRLTDTFQFTDSNGDPQTASNVFSGDGRYDAVFRTYASSIAVPEPASWALLIIGFGLTGTALRRRAGRLAGVA
jgi:hypothetical protein